MTEQIDMLPDEEIERIVEHAFDEELYIDHKPTQWELELYVYKKVLKSQLALTQPLIEQARQEKLEFAHFVISHLWQFARGSGYPLKWEITDGSFRAVLKHYGIKWGEERKTTESRYLGNKGGGENETD